MAVFGDCFVVDDVVGIALPLSDCFCVGNVAGFVLPLVFGLGLAPLCGV